MPQPLSPPSRKRERKGAVVPRETTASGLQLHAGTCRTGGYSDSVSKAFAISRDKKVILAWEDLAHPSLRKQ